MTDHITNKALFAHSIKSNAGSPGSVEESLRHFLSSAKYPWELLGPRLGDFLDALIARVDPSKRLLGEIHRGAILEGSGIVVEPGAVVEPTAYIVGPCYICRGAVVRHGAYIRGQVFVGTGAVVGHTTEVKGSILLHQAKAAHFAYVGNSLLGADTNLGAGTKLANFRFDHGPVSLKIASRSKEDRGDEGTPLKVEVVSTGLKKLGAILGDRAQTGCNAVTNPGTILTAGSWLKPGEVASGVIARRAPGSRD